MFCDFKLTKLTDDIETDYVHFNPYINLTTNKHFSISIFGLLLEWLVELITLLRSMFIVAGCRMRLSILASKSQENMGLMKTTLQLLISQRVFLKDRLWSLSGHIISQWQRSNGSERAPFMHRSYSTSIFNFMTLNSRMEKS